MSNIFLKKKIKCSKNILDLSYKDHILNKHDGITFLSYTQENVPAQKEWFNSIYSYNKNYLKNIPPYDKIVYELIKSFFNLYFSKLKNKKKKRIARMRLKRLSINRILVSKAEISHTNKKAFFNIYIYNGEKRYIINKLKKIKSKIRKEKKKKQKKLIRLRFWIERLLKRINIVCNPVFKKYFILWKIKINIKKTKKEIKKSEILKHSKDIIYFKYKKYENKYRLNNRLKIRLNRLINRYNNIYIDNIAKDNIDIYNKYKFTMYKNNNLKYKYTRAKELKKAIYVDIYSSIYNKWWERITKESIEKMLLIRRLKQHYKYLLLINKSKFENTFIYPLYRLISRFYEKKIEFNIINLKYLHLNSNILSQFLAIKIKNRKNRYLNILKKFLINLKLPKFNRKAKYLFNNKQYWLSIFPKYKNITTIKNKKHIDFKENEKDDILSQLIKIKILFKDRKYLENSIFNTIKHKWVHGVRLDISGRISKRFIAARSISKTKYKGTLKNIDTSFKGFPSRILRGHLKSNIQYSKINSKRRIGSFGVKGWINSL